MLAVLVVAGMAVWKVTGNDAGSSTREQFRQAVAAVAAAPAVRVQSPQLAGSVSDMTVLRGGALTGTLTVAGLDVGVMRVDGRTYIKMPEQLSGGPATALGGGLDGVAGQWVTGGTSAGLTSAGARSLVTPQELGAALSAQVESTAVFPDVEETTMVGTEQVWKATAPSGDLFVSTEAPHRVVKYAPAGVGPSVPPIPALPTFPTMPSGRPLTSLPALPTLPDLGGIYGQALRAPTVPVKAPVAGASLQEMDFPKLSDAQVERTYRDLVAQVGKLTDAVDTSYQFDVKGTAAFTGCGPASCTVTQALTTSFSSTNMEAPKQVSVDVTATMTGDGAPVGGCTSSGTVPVNGAGTLRCTNVSAAWSAFWVRASTMRGAHVYTAQVRAVAKAVTTAKIKQIQGDLLDELAEILADQKATGQPSVAVSAKTSGRPSAAPTVVPSQSGGSKCDSVNRQAELAKAEESAEKVMDGYSRQEFRTINQTVAVLAVCNVKTGRVFSYVGGRIDLEDEQRAVAIGAGLLPVDNPNDAVHAEPLVITEAKTDAAAVPVSPIVIYASNPFCGEDKENCKELVASEPGAQIVAPVKPKRKSRAAIFTPGIVWP
ncbi:hypothetical protein Acsp01_60960 [Actinoplanes sp. NBRC 101535]|nr:hypothetical protein Acsp01_60960 [Actinoplanes sp. NBRC 101535]